MRNVRRKQVEQNRKRRDIVFLTFGILLFIYLTVNIFIGDSGLLKYLELKSIKENLLIETSAIKKQNRDIKGQVETLENEPDTVEGLARDYGLTKKGEWIFKFEDE